MMIAGGFFSRETIPQNTDRHALHMAEVFRIATTPGTPGDYPENKQIQNPDPAANVCPWVWEGGGLAVAALAFRVVTRTRG